MPTPSEQPRVDQPVVDNSGRVTRAWADYFLRMASAQTSSDLRALYEALAARVAQLEDGQTLSFQIVGAQSVVVNGFPQPGGIVSVQLDGDQDAPGNTAYYGTGPDGVRGWFPLESATQVVAGELSKAVGSDGVATLGLADLAATTAGTLQAITRDAKGRVSGVRDATITGTAQQIDVANGNAAAGLPTLSLADLPNSGVGAALVKITRDSKGRVSGTASATTDDLAEGAGNLYYTDERAAAAAPVQSVNEQTGDVVLTAADIGAATEAQGALADTAVQEVVAGPGMSVNNADPQRPVITSLAPKGYIDGMKMVWNSAGSITFESGTAYIESLSEIVELATSVTKSVSGLTPNTFYHNYLYTSGGVADVEISATAPATPYIGTARSKTGDPSRRYIGSFLSTAAGGIRRFVQYETEVSYLDTLGTMPYRILAAGSATTTTPVSVLPAAPITAVQFKGQLINNVATGFFVISAPGGTLEIISIPPSSRVVQYLPIFNSQMFYYNTNTGGSSFIDLHAYVFER